MSGAFACPSQETLRPRVAHATGLFQSCNSGPANLISMFLYWHPKIVIFTLQLAAWTCIASSDMVDKLSSQHGLAHHSTQLVRLSTLGLDRYANLLLGAGFVPCRVSVSEM